jgi:DNA-binding transcriptional regulator YhcF (GntR family)
VSLFDNLPVYRQIEVTLKEHIAENRLDRHARLPSESQLAAQFGANVGTVRKALNNLISENIIYRKHGLGTFVSARCHKGKVLIVPTHEKVSELARADYFDFFMGAMAEASASDLPCEPLIVGLDDFLSNTGDLKLVYPDLSGVIFFRGIQNCFAAEKKLRALKIPFMYYGPNIYGDLSGRFPCFYHNESTVCEIVADYLSRKGHSRVAGVLDSSLPVFISRSELFERAAPSRGLTYTTFRLSQPNAPEDCAVTGDSVKILKRAVADNDVLLCFYDAHAIAVIQLLEREMGKRVPRDIAVMGVNNNPAGKIIRPTLTSVAIDNHLNGRECIRRFASIAQIKKPPFPAEDCKLELIERESC